MKRRIGIEDAFEAFLAYPFNPGAGIIAFLRTWLRRRQPFGEAIEKASAALERAATLTGELQKQLEEQNQRIRDVIAEYERYKVLAAATKEQASAFLKQLDQQLRRGAATERKWAIVINLVVGLVLFIIGVVLGKTILSP